MVNVETYSLRHANGSHIRKATRVIFEDGYTVKFIDRMPKGLAIAQAREIRARELRATLRDAEAAGL